MITRNLILAILLAAPLVIAAGCATQARSEPTFGEVTGYQPGVVGYLTARVVTVNIDGQEQAASNLYNYATLLVFLDKPCSPESREILKSSTWLDSAVTIIMVTSAPEDCAAEKQCIQGFDQPVGHVVALCDPQQALRGVYGVRAKNAVLLLDEVGFVTDHGTLSQYDALRVYSENVARQARVDEYDLLRGGAGRIAH
jgi:hypothetical protein